MIGTIDGAGLAQMMIHASATLNSQKQTLNDLNVFPVPDGDTGTNMGLTLAAAATELGKKTWDTASAAANATSSALLRGARGNSGVILSLLFRGFAKYLKENACETVDGASFAIALDWGVATAYKAVMKPAEGTILTVSRLSARRAAEVAREDKCLELVLDEAIQEAEIALADTTNQNPVLKKAGVVDAGGMGYLLILQGMLAHLRGEPMPVVEDTAPTAPPSAFTQFETGDIQFAYCTEFICGRENSKNPEDLRRFLDNMGDSLVLVDDEEIIKVHVHTNHPGKVLEEALTYGPLITVKIENMKEQHTEIVGGDAPAEAPAPTGPVAPEEPFGFVSVCAGDGLSSVFRDLGVAQIISGGQTMNPSTQDILAAIEQTPAHVVYVLPNNKNIIMAAEQCISMVTDRQVIVLPSKTVPQGITALLSFDPEASAEDNTAAMEEAMAGVHTSQITSAARNSDFDGLDIKQGHYLALSGGALFGSGEDMEALLRQLAQDEPQQNAEFLNLYYGEDVTQEQAEAALAILQEACPNAEVTLLQGGQPVYYYILSAE